MSTRARGCARRCRPRGHTGRESPGPAAADHPSRVMRPARSSRSMAQTCLRRRPAGGAPGTSPRPGARRRGRPSASPRSSSPPTIRGASSAGRRPRQRAARSGATVNHVRGYRTNDGTQLPRPGSAGADPLVPAPARRLGDARGAAALGDRGHRPVAVAPAPRGRGRRRVPCGRHGPGVAPRAAPSVVHLFPRPLRRRLRSDRCAPGRGLPVPAPRCRRRRPGRGAGHRRGAARHAARPR